MKIRLHRNKWFCRASVAAGVLSLVWYVSSCLSGRVEPCHGFVFPLLALTVPLATLMLLVSVVLCALSRRWVLCAILAAVAALLWPSHTIPLNVLKPCAPAPGEATDTLKLMTYNVMGFENLDATVPTESETLKYILDTAPDIVVLQEATPSFVAFDRYPHTKPLVERLDSIYPYRCHGYHDMVMFSKYPYEVHSDTTKLYAMGAPDNCMVHYSYPVRFFEMTMPGYDLTIASAHLQSFGLTRRISKQRRVNSFDDDRSWTQHLREAFEERANEARRLRKWLDSNKSRNVVVCGDFNDVPGSCAYLTILGHDLRDAYRETAVGYHNTFRLKHLMFRIDHVLYRGDQIKPIAISSPHVGTSDHYPTIVTFVVKK